MSAPVAIGTTSTDDSGVETFRGAYVHWTTDEPDRLLDGISEQFENIDQFKERVEYAIQHGGCSTFDDFLDGNFYGDRGSNLITGDRISMSESYVDGYWVLMDSPYTEDELKKEIDEVVEEDLKNDPDADQEELRENAFYLILEEDGLGYIGGECKFAIAYVDGNGRRIPSWVKRKSGPKMS